VQPRIPPINWLMGNHQLFWSGKPAEVWAARLAIQCIRLVRIMQSMTLQRQNSVLTDSASLPIVLGYTTNGDFDRLSACPTILSYFIIKDDFRADLKIHEYRS